MLLDATTKSLEFKLAGSVTTNQLPAVAFYADHTATTFTPGEADVTSNNGSAVTLVAAPAGSTQRQVKYLSIFNADTVSAVVTVQYNNNGTTRTIIKVTLATGYTLQYYDHEGWQVLNASGEIQNSSSTLALHAIDSTTSHAIGSLTNTYLVKSDGTKLVNATNIDSDVADAVTKKHARQHAVDSTSDHSMGSLSANYLVATKSDGTVLVNATNTDAEVSRAVSGTCRYVFFADTMDTPNTADWKINALAPATPDSLNAALTVRQFDDTAEEGIGFSVEIPTGVTNLVLDVRARAETAPGAAKQVICKLYNRDVPDNAAVSAWSAGVTLTAIDIPITNAYFQYDSQTIALSTLGATAGRITQFELTRYGASASDTLVGDWELLEVRVRFT